MRLNACFAAAAACLAIAACDRSDPPSEKMRDAMVGAVEAVDGKEAPRLAEGRYAPREECTDIEGAAAFRSSLRAAVADSDVAALSALAAPDIRLDFGGGGGRETLARNLRDPDNALWAKLDQLVTLGCAPAGKVGAAGGIVLPWVFAQDVEVDDPFAGMIVTGERIPLHRAASETSEVLESISWDVVELDGGLRPGEAFQKVTSSAGASGYIATDSLRSLVDYRLFAEPRGDTWQITALVAGD